MLGASDSCEARLLAAYACLPRLLPPRTYLTIRMVGPQLTALPPPVTFGSPLAAVHVAFSRALYHHEAGWHEAPAGSRTSSRPTLALAHNAGLAEYASWQPTVEQLASDGVPFFFTSYAEVEVNAAQAKLREWLHPHLSARAGSVGSAARLHIHTELNPFRQPLDRAGIVSGGCVAVPWISNGWLSRVGAPPPPASR